MEWQYEAALHVSAFDALDDPPPTEGFEGARYTSLTIALGGEEPIEVDVIVLDDYDEILDEYSERTGVEVLAVLPLIYTVQHAIGWNRRRDTVSLWRYEPDIAEDLYQQVAIP